MDFLTSRFTGTGLSRRQFGVVVGGGAFLALAGGSCGIIAKSPQNLTTGVATSFGSLTVVRAGRLARLDAQGRSAFTSLAAAAPRVLARTGPNGAAGTRRVTSTEPLRSGGGSGSGHGHGHDGGAPGDPDGPEPVNLTWADVVLVDVELHNDGQRPALFSPGQLRLKLASSATTVTPQDSDRAPGPIAPHSSEHILISYLAPRDVPDLALEFSDEQQDRSLALPP